MKIHVVTEGKLEVPVAKRLIAFCGHSWLTPYSVRICRKTSLNILPAVLSVPVDRSLTGCAYFWTEPKDTTISHSTGDVPCTFIR